MFSACASTREYPKRIPRMLRFRESHMNDGCGNRALRGVDRVIPGVRNVFSWGSIVRMCACRSRFIRGVHWGRIDSIRSSCGYTWRMRCWVSSEGAGIRRMADRFRLQSSGLPRHRRRDDARCMKSGLASSRNAIPMGHPIK